MEFLRHPLYSILAVIFLGALSGALAHFAGRRGGPARPSLPVPSLPVMILIGIGAAFLGFHAAMLSNVATGVILMPFGVALVISLLVSFALRDGAR